MSFNEIIQHCAQHRLTEEQAVAFCSDAGLTRDEFIDSCARHIAHSYATGGLSYDICDAAINEVVGSFARHNVSKYAWAVFEAFDMGEFHHHGDPPEINPENKYTKAMIAEVIANETAAF